MAKLVLSAPLGKSTQRVIVGVPDSHQRCLRDLAAVAGVLYGLRSNLTEDILTIVAASPRILPIKEIRDRYSNPIWEFTLLEEAQKSCAAEATLRWIQSHLAEVLQFLISNNQRENNSDDATLRPRRVRP